MGKIAIFIATLFSFAACDLNKLEPAQTKAFMKYFGDNGNTTGVDLLKLDDGYLLLGNNELAGQTTAILIKVDFNGNQLWVRDFPDNTGSALVLSTDGYFIIGDGIDSSNPQDTRMSLIKTNLDGDEISSVSIGEPNIDYHGTALTISTANEVVVSGYIEDPLVSNFTFLFGYNLDLSPSGWTLRKFPVNNPLETSSTLLENTNGNFVWTSLVNTSSGMKLNAVEAAQDSESPIDNTPLLGTLSASADIAKFNSTNTGAVLVQSITGPNRIAFSRYEGGTEKIYTIQEEGNSLFAQAVVQSTGDNEYVVLGNTDKHTNGSDTRSDLDFYLTKVGADGTVNKDRGFTKIIGGTGNETGAAIVEADDGGYVFLGTMKNTNEVELMVLVKVNSKGELIN